ncbi:MAG: SRPBCC family protein [Microbacterium sp.]
MFTVTETVSIARSAQDAFAFFTDVSNRPKWDTTVISEELTSPSPVAVGSTIHTRMRAMGREVDFDWRVTHFDAPSRMAVASTAGLMSTSLTFDVTPVGAGCEVSATIAAEPEGMMQLVEPLIAQGVRSTLAGGLARARTLLETPAGG